MTIFVGAQGRLQPGRAVPARRATPTREGAAYLEPGLQFDSGLALLSFGIAFVFGTAGLPHILMRFFTVPDAKAARGSVGWAVFLIGSFYLMVMFVGIGARALLTPAEGEGVRARPATSRCPSSRSNLGGGEGSAGGDIFLAVISAVALATILAVVAGLVISASGAVAHDMWSNVVRKGRDSEKEEVWVAKVAAVAIGVLSIALALVGGAEFNVSVLVGLAFCFASSVTFPALLLALWWREFNTMGAVIGMSAGMISSTVLIILSNPVWPGETLAARFAGPRQPGDLLHPDRVPGLLPGHEAVVRSAATSASTRSSTCARRPGSGPRSAGEARHAGAATSVRSAAPEPVGTR